MKKKQRIKLIIIAAALLLVLASFLIVIAVIDNNVKKSEQDRVNRANDTEGAVYLGDKMYVPNNNLETLLLIGTDMDEARRENGRQYSQADFIALVVLDKVKKSFKVIHINRDTMTDVDILDEMGNVTGTSKLQITLSYAYGADSTAACKNTVKAVKNLLYGIRIDHYLAMTMDAIPILNDSIGGVTVELLEDFTELGPEFVKGAKVTLNGKQAMRYIQERSSTYEFSNLSRMERQQQYVSAFFDQYKAAENVEVEETYKKVAEYLTSNCTMDQVTRLIELMMESYTNEGVVSLEGEAKVGTEFIEYYPDETKLQQLIMDVFYKESKISATAE